MIVYGRRLHTISLIVVRAEGLPFPPTWPPARACPAWATATERGFSVVLWRDRDLGYLLVSDVSGDELLTLASRLVPRTADSPPPSPAPQ